ncbi:MAG TPA: thiamine pyrophosphate-binding protein [Thermoanaerobaculia bacterium]|nr:thiamine pyrophosphate-binding protein [Thermoanaerobaculia bacterium]
MDSVELAAGVIEAVRAAGVHEFCVCAGSRNAPLLAVLGSLPVRLFSFVDERSAAFFALGRIKLHGAPVAVVTTSGTAAAELLPAAVEAFYSGLPLVLVTADRPARFRGTGAPQSIEQVGLFGVYASPSIADWSRRGALHINVEIDEPWNDAVPAAGPAASRAAAPKSGGGTPPRQPARTPAFRNAVVVIGALADKHRGFVKERIHAPVYAEPLSGLREHSTIPFERMIKGFDHVIRIGNVPTLRFWRDLESLDVEVTHFSDLPFPGLTRGEVYPIEELPEIHGRDIDQSDYTQRFEQILEDEPQSELAMFRKLSEELPDGARIYLGNSLPIREWDLAATREPRGFVYEANRGANGIDGQLSTFFGWCAPDADNVCIVGDLTAIYDLGAPWIVPQLDARFRIVVINNGGGRIFGRVGALRGVDPALRARIIENEHDVRFEHWAKMWNIDVTELRPDAEASRRSWERYDALWA